MDHIPGNSSSLGRASGLELVRGKEGGRGRKRERERERNKERRRKRDEERKEKRKRRKRRNKNKKKEKKKRGWLERERIRIGVQGGRGGQGGGKEAAPLVLLSQSQFGCAWRVSLSTFAQQSLRLAVRLQRVVSKVSLEPCLCVLRGLKKTQQDLVQEQCGIRSPTSHLHDFAL